MLMQGLIAIGGTLLAVAGAVLAAYLWETKLRDRVTVHRIRRSDDEYLESLLELYQRLFDDDSTNYSPAEILEFIDDADWATGKRHVVAENIVLAALFKHNVVGFLFCHFYPERRKAIISYYGIDKKVAEAKHHAARSLLVRLKRILVTGDHPCDYLFFDLQGVDFSTPKAKARERRARPVLFKQSARSLGLEAHLLEFPYVCPKVSLSHDTREYPFTLMCVPIRGKLSAPVSRETVLEFLRFIHLDCYGDLYPVADPKFAEYQKHLSQRLAHYEQVLPPAIPVT